MSEPSSERQFIMYEALRKGADIEALYEKTYIKPWFIQQMKELVDLEEEILQFKGKDIPDATPGAGQERRIFGSIPRAIAVHGEQPRSGSNENPSESFKHGSRSR